MKKITTIMICLVLFMSLVSCGNKSDVSGNDKEGVFTELIPSEIYNYTFEGECYTSKLTNVEIIRETTKNDLYDGTAKLTLDDDNLTRTVELTLHGRKYDKGGWNLESYNIDNSDGIVWKKKGITEIIEQKYKGYSKKEIQYSAETNSGTLELLYKSFYLELSGTLEFTTSTSVKKQNGNLDYIVGVSITQDNLKYNWKIDGTWTWFDDDGEIRAISIKQKSDSIIEACYTDEEPFECKASYNSSIKDIESSSLYFKAGRNWSIKFYVNEALIYDVFGDRAKSLSPSVEKIKELEENQ